MVKNSRNCRELVCVERSLGGLGRAMNMECCAKDLPFLNNPLFPFPRTLWQGVVALRASFPAHIL